MPITGGGGAWGSSNGISIGGPGGGNTSIEGMAALHTLNLYHFIA